MSIASDKFELRGVKNVGVCSFCLVNITNEVIVILIKQTRINNCNCFAAAVPGTPVRLRVEDVGRFKNKLRAFGFKETDENGTTILPSGVNRYAKKNAEPFFTDKQAEETFERLVRQMAEREGVTEQLKAADQMEWVGCMNNIRNRAIEVVNTEIVFA